MNLREKLAAGKFVVTCEVGPPKGVDVSDMRRSAERVRGIRQIFWMGEPVSQYGDVVIDDIPRAFADLGNPEAHAKILVKP